MDNRRCLYCGRKLHPALRPDAKYCGRSCKSSYHRDKHQQGGAARAPVHFPVRVVMMQLASTILAAAPKGAEGYVLRRHNCPLGSGIFDFPVPMRRTKHADGSLINSSVYQLQPFEPPRLPWAGPYELLFWVPPHGLVSSQDPQHQHVHMSRDWIVPRAAFDKHALSLWVPAPEDPDLGSTEYLQREVLARAPTGAIGYSLHTSSSPLESGPVQFPPRDEFSRRANRGISNVPYYSLKPFELPCVPWAGTYLLSYQLESGVVFCHPDPTLKTIRVGLIFPYADYSKPKPAQSAALTLLPGKRPLLLGGPPGPKRALRLRRAGKR